MTCSSRRRAARPLVLALSLLTAFPSAADAAEAPPTGDELIVGAATALATSPLPRGPVRPEILTLSEPVVRFTVLPDGRLVGITETPPGNGPPTLTLVEIAADGQVTEIGGVEPDPRASFGESAADLVVDGRGWLYLLAFGAIWWNPPDGFPRLVRLDPADAATLGSVDIDELTAWPLAPAPTGLWSVGPTTLRRLDPDTGIFTDTGIPLPPFGGFAADVDSTGAIWVVWEGVCSPPCFQIYRLDPATGAVRTAPNSLRGNVMARELAVRRRCLESPTARCHQGGRFRAEVSWRDSVGATGDGRGAPSRSADTTLFWFFDPANWELMVKVLDGCDLGGHFWVFASASTDVGYDLTVTDLETGATRSYTNPLGRVAATVTDTSAFACP